jgi:hypothetical protein
MLCDRAESQIQGSRIHCQGILQSTEGIKGPDKWISPACVFRQYSVQVCPQPYRTRRARSLKLLSLSRTTLELLKSTYFSDEAAGSRSQPAFSSLEVLYVQSDADTDETVQQHRQDVAEYGLELSIVNLEKAFEGSQMAIDVSSSGNSRCVTAIASKPDSTCSSDLHLSTSTVDSTPLLKDSNFTASSQETLSSTVLATFIAKYAEEKGHKAVIFCDSATKLAAKTITAISKGQGWNLGELVSGGDIPIAGSSEYTPMVSYLNFSSVNLPLDVRIYRPLSVISDDEVRFFANNVHDWPMSDTLVKRSGIDGLVEG